MSILNLEKNVLETYRALDRHIKNFQLRSGLRCGHHCGACCDSSRVEATTLECLPLAYAIFRRGREDVVSLSIERNLDEDDYQCVLYLPDSENSGLGRCSWYPFRPLICRLFGYAVRKNKYGKLELSACRVMQDHPFENQSPRLPDTLEHLNPPVYQSSFLRIACLDPATGFHLLPINHAIKEAMEYVYWHRPKTRPRYRKAA